MGWDAVGDLHRVPGLLGLLGGVVSYLFGCLYVIYVDTVGVSFSICFMYILLLGYVSIYE